MLRDQLPASASSTPPDVATASSPPPTGHQAFLAAAVAIFGVVTALFPNAPVIAALTAAIPPLRTALPIVLTSVGSVWAALSHPPTLGKGS
ncbi:MAG TPA: hypothetical protein VNU46_03980 [Gemmatimonadaceae bacterium]|nr:hypothetical protein [Gemmatimonadaceae bacterium]